MVQKYKLHFPADYWKGKKRGKMSDEVKNKIRKAKLGTKMSLKTKLKMSVSGVNRYLDKSERLKARILQKKRILSGNHNWWKGGISRAYKTGYYSSEYKDWRELVFKRDDYICQKCFGKRGQYITAHHIKSFAHYPKLRFKLSNGLTLCEDCHKETDNYKGRRKNKKI